MKLKIKKLNSEAKLPNYANPGDAGLDFFCLAGFTIESGQRVLVETGVAVEIPDGFVGLIWDKSGLAVKKGIKTMAGVIDSSYRGEIKIMLLNTGSEAVFFEAGDKIAQMLIQKVENMEILEVDELSNTQRGAGGFGSTGTK